MFEVIIVVVLLMTAIVFVDQLGERPDTHDTSRDWYRLKGHLEDTMGAWSELPPFDSERKNPDTELGANQLERLLRERIVDPEEGRSIWGRLGRVYFDDIGTRFRLEYNVLNEWATLYGEEHPDPTGENVGITRLIYPKWNAVHAHAKADPLDGTTGASFETLFVNKSRVALQPGHPVKFALRYGGFVEGAATETHTFGIAAQVPRGDVPTVNMRWITIGGSDVTPTSDSAATIPIGGAGTKLPFDLELAPLVKNISAGTRLNIRLDSGFAETFNRDESNFKLVETARNPDGSVILVLEATAGISNGNKTTARFSAVPYPLRNNLGLIDPTSPYPP